MPSDNPNYPNLPSELPDLEGQVLTQPETDVREPPMYRVLLLNDDYTPMDFVIWVLQNVFHKSSEDSTRIMMQVHTQGSGLCGVFPYDVARTKVFQVQTVAKKNSHPLQCVMEPEAPSETFH